MLTDLERLRRMLSRGGYSMPYVAVLECQKRGAIHPHLAVRGFQDIRLLRRCCYKIVGKAQGQVNVKGPRPGTSPVKLARYLSKYISKDIEHLKIGPLPPVPPKNQPSSGAWRDVSITNFLLGPILLAKGGYWDRWSIIRTGAPLLKRTVPHAFFPPEVTSALLDTPATDGLAVWRVDAA